VFESFNDHRIAMAFGILSLLLKDGGKVDNFECVNISNPNFLKQISGISS
jgi:5-enolpyruvylshikimate-3-phosphate synthase